jgi:hypothetical protein
LSLEAPGSGIQAAGRSLIILLKLGISHAALAKKLEMSLACGGFSVERGKFIATSANYSLDV